MPGFTQPLRDVIHSLEEKDEHLALRLYYKICYEARYSPDPITLKGIEIKQGQWLRSIRQLREDLSYKTGKGGKKIYHSHDAILRAISILEFFTKCPTERTPEGTLFTLPKVEENQELKPEKQLSKKRSSNTRTNAERTQNEQDSNKEKEGEKKDLQKESSTTIDLHIAETSVSATHTEGEDPRLVVKVRKDCQIFRCSDREVDLLAAWYTKNGLPTDLLPKVAVVIDRWMVEGATPTARAARKSASHYRRCQATWAIAEVQKLERLAKGNGHKTSNMDLLKASLAKARAEEEQKRQQNTGGLLQ